MPARQHAKVTKWLSERFDGQEGMKLHIKRKHLCASLNITSLVIGKQDTQMGDVCSGYAIWRQPGCLVRITLRMRGHCRISREEPFNLQTYGATPRTAVALAPQRGEEIFYTQGWPV